MYEILLSDDEVGTLAWLTDRGYWPAEAYDGMYMRDDQPDDLEAGVWIWEITESAAWSITELADDDPDAFLACCGDPLREKLVDLWQSIV